MKSGRCLRFLPSVEALEERTLMASQLTASLSAAGLLRIDGTPEPDHIELRQAHDRISVEGIRINVEGRGSMGSVSMDAVSRIEIHSYGGDDYIQLGGDAEQAANAIRKPAIIWGGPGDNFILGSQGDDQVWVGDGNNVIFGRGGDDGLRGGGGTNYLVGGGGNDVIKSSSGRDTIGGGSGHDDVFLTDGAGSIRGVEEINGSAGSRRSVEEVKPPSAPRPAAPAVQGPFRQQVRRLIDLTNAYRSSRGLSSLDIDPRLVEAASYQAKYMARTDHYSHVNLDGRNLADRSRAAGYSFHYVAENIHLYDPAVRRTLGINRVYQPSELAQYYFDGWRVSPHHNENLLASDPRDIGIAMAQNGAGRIYVAQLLGRR